jgi:hypothetical protein
MKLRFAVVPDGLGKSAAADFPSPIRDPFRPAQAGIWVPALAPAVCLRSLRAFDDSVANEGRIRHSF